MKLYEYLAEDIDFVVGELNKLVRAGCPLTYTVGEPYYAESAIIDPLTGETGKGIFKVRTVSLSCRFEHDGDVVVGKVERSDEEDCNGMHNHRIKIICEEEVTSEFCLFAEQCHHYCKFECDACRSNRIRNNVYIVRKADGEFVTLGSECVKNVFGYDAQIIDGFSVLQMRMLAKSYTVKNERDLGSVWELGGRLHELRDMVAAAVRAVDMYGFIPAKEENSTKERALEMLRLREQFDESELSYADKIIEWARSITPDQMFKSDYLTNLKIIMLDEYVAEKVAGYVCSSIIPFRNETKEDKGCKFEFFGNEGERVKFLVNACDVSVTTTPTRYGKLHIVKMISDNRLFVWKTTVSPDIFKTKYTDGDIIYEISGIVKEHLTYSIYRQTMIKNCKVNIIH